MRLGSGRSLAVAMRTPRASRAFSSTPLQSASKVPEPPNMRQAQRPRTSSELPLFLCFFVVTV